MDDLQVLVDVLRDDKVVAYNTVAACCLLLYDIILSARYEIKYIWKSSWSLIKILHILIRYYALFYLVMAAYVSISTDLSLTFCHVYYPFDLYGVAPILPAIDILILTRIYALYSRDRKIAFILVSMWIAETITIFVSISKGFRITAVVSSPLPGVLPGCFPAMQVQDAPILRGTSIAVVFQGIYLGLCLHIMFRQARAFRLLDNLTPMLKIFYRDGAMFCLTICVMYLVSILSAKYGGISPLQLLGQVWLVPIIPISAGRLVLNLRGSLTSSDTNDGDEESTEVDVWTGQEEQVGQFTSVIIIGNMGTRNSHSMSSLIL